MNRGSRFTGSWRQFTQELKLHLEQHSNSEMLEADGVYDEIPQEFSKRGGEQKKEIELWAEDWCERGGWRK